MRKLIVVMVVGIFSATLAHATNGRGGTPPRAPRSDASAKPCVDSDPADDPVILGSVKIANFNGKSLEQWDTCKGKYVEQWDCNGGQLSPGNFHFCESGCAKGVCLPPPPPPVCVDHDEMDPSKPNPQSLLTPSFVELSVNGKVVETHLDKCFLDPPQLQMIGEAVCTQDHTGWMPTLQPCPAGTQCQLNGSGMAYCGKTATLNTCTDLNPKPDLTNNAGVSFSLNKNPAQTVPNKCLADVPALVANYSQFADKKAKTVLDMVCQDIDKDGMPDLPGAPVAVLCPDTQICKDGACVVVPIPAPVCGNSQVEAGEQCDDGNIKDGDGCSAKCLKESSDKDKDGIIDEQDNCPTVPNKSQVDADKDGIGDACDDCIKVNFPPTDQPNACNQINQQIVDSDRDGIEDSKDNCPYIANVDQMDVNGNKIGDGCEPGAVSGKCPVGNVLYPSEILTADVDGNGIYDACEFPKLISHDVQQIAGDLSSFAPSISGNGHAVAFSSNASSLVVGDSNGKQDVFLWNALDGTVKRVSVGESGQEGNDDARFQDISTDGSTVVIQSSSGNLTQDDVLGKNADIFTYDIKSAKVARVSFDVSQCNMTESFLPVVNANGCAVAFAAISGVAPDYSIYGSPQYGPSDVLPANKFSRIRRHDRSTGKIADVGNSYDLSDSQKYNRSAISADGNVIAFQTMSALIPGSDSGTELDVYVSNSATGQLTLVSARPDGKAGNHQSEWPSISADGNVVAFESLAHDLGPVDDDAAGDSYGNGSADVYVRDLKTSTTELVSLAIDGQLFGKLPCGNPDISADGRYVVFTAGKSEIVTTNPVDPAEQLLQGVYVYDRQSKMTKKVANLPTPAGTFDGAPDNGYAPAISADGRFIAFVTRESLTAKDTTGLSDIYLVVNPLWPKP